jgi:hypothetical protein
MEALGLVVKEIELITLNISTEIGCNLFNPMNIDYNFRE